MEEEGGERKKGNEFRVNERSFHFQNSLHTFKEEVEGEGEEGREREEHLHSFPLVTVLPPHTLLVIGASEKADEEGEGVNGREGGTREQSH